MPRRTDISSILAICSLGLLAGCGFDGVETQDECRERFTELFDAAPLARNVRPIFTYDVTNVETPEGELSFFEPTPGTTMTIVKGPRDRAVETFLAVADLDAPALLAADGLSLYRIEREVVASDRAIERGCVPPFPNARLVHIAMHSDPRPTEETN